MESRVRQLFVAVQELNGSYNFVQELLPLESVLASITNSDAGTGDNAPLSDLTFTVKDSGSIQAKGLRCSYGSKLLKGVPPEPNDGAVMQRLKNSGAVLLGRVTGAEFGWKASCSSPLFGTTLNPLDTKLCPGGSSGGSASAVAAGFGDFSLGTDGGGSIRIPAACCGLVGVKPTFGQVPMAGSSSLSHVGPLARDVRTAARVMQVISGPDSSDWYSMHAAGPTEFYKGVDKPSFTDPMPPSELASLRIGYSVSMGGIADVEPAVLTEFMDAIARLKAAGLKVECADEPLIEALKPALKGGHPWENVMLPMWMAKAANTLTKFPADAVAANMDPGLQLMAAEGSAYTAGALMRAEDGRVALGRAMAGFHKDHFDFILSPVIATKLPAINDCDNDWRIDDGTGEPMWKTRVSIASITFLANLTLQPAVALPLPWKSNSTGLGHVAMQIMGACHDDARMLRLAQVVEDLGKQAAALPTPPN